MNEQTLWIILTAVGIAGAVVIGLGLKKLNSRIKEVNEKFVSPLLRFRYTANDAIACADTLQKAGIGKLYDRFSLMMLAMMAEVLILLMAATHNITELVWLQYGMFAMSGLIWLTGTAEAALIKKAPAVSSVLSLIKWGAFAVWTLGMFVGLFIRSTAY